MKMIQGTTVERGGDNLNSFGTGNGSSQGQNLGLTVLHVPRKTRAAPRRECFFFFFTLVTGPRRSLSLKLSGMFRRFVEDGSLAIFPVFKAHRLLYHSNLGLRVIKKKKNMT